MARRDEELLCGVRAPHRVSSRRASARGSSILPLIFLNGGRAASVACGRRAFLDQLPVAEAGRRRPGAPLHGPSRCRKSARSRSVYLKFLGRYALLIIAAYAILRGFKLPAASSAGWIICRNRSGTSGIDRPAFPVRARCRARRFLKRWIMAEQPIWFTVFLNRLFAKPVLALLAALHIQPANPAYPDSQSRRDGSARLSHSQRYSSSGCRARISVDRPGGTQQCMEALLTNSMGVGIRDLLEDNVGPRRE